MQLLSYRNAIKITWSDLHCTIYVMGKCQNGCPRRGKSEEQAIMFVSQVGMYLLESAWSQFIVHPCFNSLAQGTSFFTLWTDDANVLSYYEGSPEARKLHSKKCHQQSADQDTIVFRPSWNEAYVMSTMAAIASVNSIATTTVLQI